MAWCIIAGVLACSRNNGSRAVIVLAGSAFSIIDEWNADLKIYKSVSLIEMIHYAVIRTR
jgi:hypothetical protein